MKLDVKSYVAEKEKNLIADIKWLKDMGVYPKLTILRNGEDDATNAYLRNKIKVGERVGVSVIVKEIESPFDLENAQNEIIQQDSTCILQLPVKNKFLEPYYKRMMRTVGRDVDGFVEYKNVYEHIVWSVIPATPKGIINYMYYWCQKKSKLLSHQNVLIIGRGYLIGKPLATLLIDDVKNLTICTSKTTLDEKRNMIKTADIIILATGDEHSLDGIEDFGKDKLIIDSGIFRKDNKLYGELTPHIHKLDDSIDYTPVPSGVGILTTLALFENVVAFYSDSLSVCCVN